MIKELNNFETIFNEIEEVKFNPETYEKNSEVFRQLATKELGIENLKDSEIFETLDNIIFIGSISKNSLLYSALVKWYEYKGGNMEKEIRSYVEDNDNIYYVTGCGYDTISADLLGGKADGMARKEFLQWINE